MPAGTKWTCPMHPEVIRDARGSWPICGMALEPIDAGAADEAQSRARRYFASSLLVAQSDDRQRAMTFSSVSVIAHALRLGRAEL